MNRKFTRRDFLKGLAGATAATVAFGPMANLFTEDTEAKSDSIVEDGSYIKAEQTTDGQIIDTDLLIIGTGFAGLWAALTAAEQGVERIAIVDKGSIAKSSIASITAGGTCYMDPEDNKTGWITELCQTNGFLARQDMLDDMLTTSHLRLKKLETLGVVYEPAFPGAPQKIPLAGAKYLQMSLNPTWKKKGLFGGRAVTGALAEKLQSFSNIRFFSKTLIVELLKENDAIAGAIGVHRIDGHAVTFKSKAVIMAVGSCSFRGRHAMAEVMTGDGFALAYGAGATLRNLEFYDFDTNPATYNFEGGLAIGSMGARYLNAKNEDFMWKYDPQIGSAAAGNTVSRAAAMEVQEGRGPIYMDKGTILYNLAGRNIWNTILPAKSWQNLSARRLTEVGFDDAALEEWIPTSFGVSGCVKGDTNCMTTIPGLYAAGLTLSIIPGGLVGVESSNAMWSGEKAALDAASYVKGRSAATLSESDIQQKMADAKAPLNKSGKLAPNEVLREIQEVVFRARVSILKNENELQKALNRIITIRDRDLPKMSAKDPHELIRYHETLNMALVAELSLRASLERKESRYSHYREDYPDTDNNNWLKWINFAKSPDNTPTISYERVPLEKYPVQPSLTER